jgi:hypothetical protein
VQDHILMQIKNELKSEKFQQSPGSVRMSLFIVDIPILILLMIICAKNTLLHNQKFICLP